MHTKTDIPPRNAERDELAAPVRAEFARLVRELRAATFARHRNTKTVFDAGEMGESTSKRVPPDVLDVLIARPVGVKPRMKESALEALRARRADDEFHRLMGPIT